MASVELGEREGSLCHGLRLREEKDRPRNTLEG